MLSRWCAQRTWRRVCSRVWVKRQAQKPHSEGRVMRSSQNGTGASGHRYWKPWPVMLRMNSRALAVVSTYQKYAESRRLKKMNRLYSSSAAMIP
ncbi:hypothetical protein D9M68_703500 [compost metagenome]